jgi:hypothetical protein
MAVVWIVTTGNSDVKLSSDYQWEHLRKQKREQLKPCYNDFKSPVEDADDLFLLPARVMGLVYGDALDTHWQYFCFPLLTEFTKKIKADKNNKPDRIIVLLTNQEEIFSERNSADPHYDRSDPDCPFWKDTGKLEPILQRFFDENFGAGKAKFYPLEPKTIEEGLDNWDSTLRLVQEKFKQWEISKEDRVIVSHQASTPAISSAVQFTSLAKFGEKVDFLIVNERDLTLTKFLYGSKYLKEIRKQEAEALLAHNDYAGIQDLLSEHLDSETEKLLNAAIQWNLAKFDEFAKELRDHQKFTAVVEHRVKAENWWWIGYESAHLAVIRHHQGNIVDALFHSFRSVEGLICKWAETKHKDCIVYDKKGSPQITERIKDKDDLSKYWEKIQEKQEKWLTEQNQKNQQRVEQGQEPLPLSTGLFSQSLYLLLEMDRPESKKDKNMKTVLYSAKDERNQQFHRLLGLNEENLFQAWKANDVEEWKAILLGCLNFIAREDLKSDFDTIESASLMVQVHEELVTAIANL